MQRRLAVQKKGKSVISGLDVVDDILSAAYDIMTELEKQYGQIRNQM